MRNTYSFLLFLLLLGTGLTSCRKITPGQAPPRDEQSPLPKALSTVNLNMSIPLALFESQINAKLQENLFSEKGIELGNGLFSDITVLKTGNLKLAATDSGKLRVTLPVFLDGKVTLEKRIFGQLVSAGVPFKESLTPQVSFIPRIDENWGLQIDQLEVESWGRSLQYDLLGYSLDLEPIMKRQVKRMMESQLGTNLLQGLDLKRLVEQTWEAYSEPLRLQSGPMEMYLETRPERIRVSEKFTPDQTLELAIGLEGEVLSFSNPVSGRDKAPLPQVEPYISGQSGADITLPLIVSYDWMNTYLNRELVGQEFKVDNRTVLIPHGFTTQPYGTRALVKMGFTAKRTRKKDLRGELYLVGKPVFVEETEEIRFEEIDFDLNTQHFLANSANWLKRGQILSAIQKRAVFPLGEYLAEARSELQELGSWQTQLADFSLINPDLEVAGIYVTPSDIRVYVRSKGDIAVRVKQ